MVRKELYAVALDDALANWLAEMRCDECAEDGVRRLRKKTQKESTGPNRSPFTPGGCGLHQSATSARIISGRRFRQGSAVWKTCASGESSSAYGLCLPSLHPALSPGGDPFSDPMRTIGIALPTAGLTQTYPSVATDQGDDCQFDASAHATILPSLFTLPDSLAIRTCNPFTSLVRDYQLEIDTDPTTAFPPAPKPAGSKDDAERETLGAGEPAWRLWTSMLPCTWWRPSMASGVSRRKIKLQLLAKLRASPRTTGSGASSVCPSTAGDAPFSLPCENYTDTILCPNNIQGKSGGVVLLVHGTTSSGNQSWALGPYLHQLPTEGPGFDVCWITIPGRSLGDSQLTGEYVAYAILYLAAQSVTGKISVVGHSQGGINPQWAMIYWPSTRKYVEDLVALGGDFHGTLPGSPTGIACLLTDLLEGGCNPTFIQQTTGSHYIAAQNVKGNQAFVDMTSIFTIYDDAVFPETPRNATSIVPGAENIYLQDEAICGLSHYAEHITLPVDAAAYALVVDALTHPGPASTARFNQTLCNWLVDAELLVQYNTIPLVLEDAYYGIPAILTYEKVKEEPLLKAYVCETGDAASYCET